MRTDHLTDDSPEAARPWRVRHITPEQAWDLFVLGHKAIYIGVPFEASSHSRSGLHYGLVKTREEFLEQATDSYYIEEE